MLIAILIICTLIKQLQNIVRNSQVFLKTQRRKNCVITLSLYHETIKRGVLERETLIYILF